jgi:outer membrane protein assembly factor BamB
VDMPAPPTVYTIPGQDVVATASKNGASFLLDPANMNVLARRQLLPKDGAGNPLPSVDVHMVGDTENKSGVFGSAAVDPGWGHIYFGLGGYDGVDAPTTPFMRACDWATLDDEWPTVVGADTVTRYSTAHPPMYMTAEAGLSSPVVVNDVVLVSTGTPPDGSLGAAALYAFSSANGIQLWSRRFPKSGYCLGPCVYGDFVVAGANDQLFVYKL